jgi:hypothetical protein
VRDLSFLLEEPSGAEISGLDSLDPRFTRLVDLAEREGFDELADGVRALHEEGVRDVRLVAYYCLQVFRERGLVGAAETLCALSALFDSAFPGYGPLKNRDKYLEKSLAWFFGRTADAIEYHRKKADAVHRDWRDSVDPVALEAGIEAGAQLVKQLAAPSFSSSSEALGRLLRELRTAREVATSERPAPPVSLAPSPMPSIEPPVTPRSRGLRDLESEHPVVELRVSHQFIELCQKLRAFEALVEKRNFEKAAMVGDDLMTLIEGFDPRRYFPDLFADFSSQLSANVGTIAPYWDRRGTLEWKTLLQFYQVDLKKFVGE